MPQSLLATSLNDDVLILRATGQFPRFLRYSSPPRNRTSVAKSSLIEVPGNNPVQNTIAQYPMSSTKRSRDARGILEEHVKKTYENNAFPQAWRNLPEIPTSEEIKPVFKDPITTTQEPEEWNTYQRDFIYDQKLPHNIVDGPWPSKEAYLGAHYQIIREDAIASLRNAVLEVQTHPSMEESDDTRIYTGVTFIGLQLSRIGVASRIEFSCERAGMRIRWDQSKRLVQGTIVALTPEKDMFKTICKVATVASRVIDGGLDQDPPTIDLFWGDVKDIVIDPVEKYVMVESRAGYFEASRHTMVAMQKLMTERFSFAKELVDLDQIIEAPLYVQEDPIKNLDYLERSAQEKDGLTMVPSSEVSPLFAVDVLNDFPKNLHCGMDKSQISACQNMITKRLAIVQGPPGTGKTFVSISALEVMIRNLAPGDPPIIVAAQTNHALDQLLNHILCFEPEIVRLGGRSDRENVAIKKRTFYELGQVTDTSLFRKGLGASAKEHRALCDEIIGVLSPLLNDALLTADTLLEHGLITEGQRRSLDAGDWAVEHGKDNVPTEDLAGWLTESQLMKIPGAPPVNLGFPLEEGDIEAEQLRQLEQEAADASSPEDKEVEFGLGGPWVPFGRKVTGRHTAAVVDSAARRKLSRCKDLFEIPLSDRGQMYRYFEKQMNKIVMQKLQEYLVKYKRYVEDNYITKSMFNIKLMQHLGIKVVGCTTTGLSKYRGLLSALEPRTLLIEEAAETLESKIIAGMMESLQQLILVGDHKQLQASCTVQALQDEPYNLSISMFERLVNNGMPFVMLNHQRRMVPEVRKLLCIEPDPFYTDLHDHESVLDRVNNRPPVPGMGGRNAYFFSHNWWESRTSEGSCYNLPEAEMIVAFYNYLILNGVKSSQITVLTFYNGQRKTIIKLLKQHAGLGGISYFNVFTVDSYQGEENDIILLSMVRSNTTLGVGFLDNKNRLVVALSRARRGLYLFGNSMTLAGGEASELAIGRDPLFEPLLLYMRDQGQYNIEGGLPITCAQHNASEAVRDAAKGESFLAAIPVSSCATPSTTLESFVEKPVPELCLVDMAALEIVERPAFVIIVKFPSDLSLMFPTILSIGTWIKKAKVQQRALSRVQIPMVLAAVKLDLAMIQTHTVPQMFVMACIYRTPEYRGMGDKCHRTSILKTQLAEPSQINLQASPLDEAFLPPPLYRAYGHEPIVDKRHPGFEKWANYDAKTADRELDEKQRSEAAKLPKPAASVIQETYIPVAFDKNGVRIVKSSGRVRSRVNRAQGDDSTAPKTAPTPSAGPGTVDDHITTTVEQLQAQLQKREGLDASKDKAKEIGSVQEKSANTKQKRPTLSKVLTSEPDMKAASFPSLGSKNPVKSASSVLLNGWENKAPETAANSGHQNAVDTSGSIGPRVSLAASDPTASKTPTVAATADLLGLLDFEDAPYSQLIPANVVPASLDLPGQWRSIIPSAGSQETHGTAGSESSSAVVEPKQATEDQEVLIDFGNHLPIHVSPSHKESLVEVTEVSAPAQSGVFNDSDDLISF
ncbi:hypothetical protein VTL71DRAFT_6735 [Oculimacula yallundae]|uniref:Uncharacterized protein n=1 Tax=Oculimacula yallundae TaxID=86028 RepID=A0ABR4BXS0_9HELO